MKKRFYIPLLLLVAIVAFSFTRPAERYFEIAKNLDIFATLFKEVNALYVDEVNPNTLVRTGIDAMLTSLDPYTNYSPEDEGEDFRTINTGQYGGIGAITREIRCTAESSRKTLTGSSARPSNNASAIRTSSQSAGEWLRSRP